MVFIDSFRDGMDTSEATNKIRFDFRDASAFSWHPTVEEGVIQREMFKEWTSACHDIPVPQLEKDG